MNWEERLTNGFTINNKHYCIKHLQSFTHSYRINSLNKNLICHIQFSSHCCTEEAQNRVSPAMFLNDRGTKRRFCFERYRASKNLVALIKNLNEALLKKDKGGSRNVLLVELEHDGSTDVYKIFLNVKKNKTKGIDLSMFVETAHIQYPPSHPKYNAHTAIHGKADLAKLPSIRGATYLANIFENKSIRFNYPR